MNTEQLHYLQEIFQEGSLSAAARNLNISQSTLSKFLQTMERETGSGLFIRVKNRLTPTPQGYAYLDMADRIDQLQSQMLKRIELLQSEVRPAIAIGFPRYWDYRLITPAIAAFSRQFPRTAVQSLEVSPSEFPELLKRGGIQMAVSLDDFGAAAGFQHILLGTIPILLAAPKSWEIAGMETGHGRAVHFLELAQKPFIHPGRDSILSTVIRRIFDEQMFIPAPFLENANPNFRLAQVQAQTGWTVILGHTMAPLDGVSYYMPAPACQAAVSLILDGRAFRSEEENYLIRLLQQKGENHI